MLAPWKKNYEKHRQQLKNRDITLPTKVHLVKAMVFPVVMCECESWTVKKAERWRTDAFELWCWRRLLRVPWTARRSNQSVLKEISPGCSLEGLMLKLRLQYFGHLIRRADSLEKTLMLGGIGGRRRRGRQRMRWLDGITRWTWVWVNSGSWWWTGRPGVLGFVGSQRVGHDWATDLSWAEEVRRDEEQAPLHLCGVVFGVLWFLRWGGLRLLSHIKLGALAVSHPGSTPQLNPCHFYWRNEWLIIYFQEFGLIEGLTRTLLWGSLVTQRVKNPPAVQETRFNSRERKIPWRREQLPTPVFWPGKVHGQRGLEGYSPWGHKESDITEWLSHSLSFCY